MEGVSLTIVSSKGSYDSDGQESNASRENVHLRLLLLLLHRHLLPAFVESAGYEKVSVRLELEDEVGGINEEEKDGGPAGDEKKTGSATLFDGTGLAGCPKHVEHVILNRLRHEISGGNHKRFSWKVKNEIEECGNQENTH